MATEIAASMMVKPLRCRFVGNLFMA